jgi:hypothetical protein
VVVRRDYKCNADSNADADTGEYHTSQGGVRAQGRSGGDHSCALKWECRVAIGVGPWGETGPFDFGSYLSKLDKRKPKRSRTKSMPYEMLVYTI